MTSQTTQGAAVPSMSAFIVGGSGLVGKKLVAELAQSPNFHRIVTIGRRTVPYDGPGKEKLEQHVVDFDNLDDHKALFTDIDVGFNTLGTTRAAAGSAENFIKIDHDYPLHVARLYKEANPSRPTHFCLLTGLASSATSPFLVPRTKGLLEKDMTSLGFSQLSIFRPGFLIYDGEKREKRRIVEEVCVFLVKPINPLTGGRLSAGISTVAKAMRTVAEKGASSDNGSQTRVNIYENRDIEQLGK